MIPGQAQDLLVKDSQMRYRRHEEVKSEDDRGSEHDRGSKYIDSKY